MFCPRHHGQIEGGHPTQPVKLVAMNFFFFLSQVFVHIFLLNAYLCLYHIVLILTRVDPLCHSRLMDIGIPMSLYLPMR